jgi:hypothetical protein
MIALVLAKACGLFALYPWYAVYLLLVCLTGPLLGVLGKFSLILKVFD